MAALLEEFNDELLLDLATRLFVAGPVNENALVEEDDEDDEDVELLLLLLLLLEFVCFAELPLPRLEVASVVVKPLETLSIGDKIV